MEYVGIATQQRNNNIRSLALLLCFPVLVFAMLYMTCFIYGLAINFELLISKNGGFSFINAFFSILPRIAIVSVIWLIFAYRVNLHIAALAIFLLLSYISCFILMFLNSNHIISVYVNNIFLELLPYTAAITIVWFIVAYFTHTKIIEGIVQAEPLSRRENKRVYNLVENLCISCGMAMPKVNVIEDKALNAFANGINSNSYSITLTRGIIDTLDDRELNAVIAHELTHIRNNDVRVMIIAIVFTGIFDMLLELLLRMSKSAGRSTRGRKGGGGIIFVLAAFIPVMLGYGLSILMRFAISRNREYMADAGAVELTGDSKALANALRRISGNSKLKLALEDVAQLFIEHEQPQTGIKAMFAALYESHPPIGKRIQVLEWF